MNHFEWAKSCLKKNRYDTKGMAIKIKRKAYRERRHRLRVYFCEHCNGWHLTKSLRKQMRNEENRNGSSNCKKDKSNI